MAIAPDESAARGMMEGEMNYSAKDPLRCLDLEPGFKFINVGACNQSVVESIVSTGTETVL